MLIWAGSRLRRMASTTSSGFSAFTFASKVFVPGESAVVVIARGQNVDQRAIFGALHVTRLNPAVAVRVDFRLRKAVLQSFVEFVFEGRLYLATDSAGLAIANARNCPSFSSDFALTLELTP